MNRVLVVLVMLVISGCNTAPDEGKYRLESPKTVEPGKKVSVTLKGRLSGNEKITWAANVHGDALSLNAEGNGQEATFLAPKNGPITLTCAIVRPNENPVALAAEIQVSEQSVGAANPGAGPEVSPAGTVLDIGDAGFLPSGWMGDIGALKVNTASMEKPHSPPNSQRWTFTPTAGSQSWAAVAWQFPENNWGGNSGKNLSGRGFKEVSFWARGIKTDGVYPKIQFKAGGTTKNGEPYQASFEVVGDKVKLEEDWKRFSLPLNNANLSQVVAGFVFVIQAQDIGPSGATFYLDDIEYR